LAVDGGIGNRVFVCERSPQVTVEDLDEFQIIHVGRGLLHQWHRLKNVFVRKIIHLGLTRSALK
jgi:hypothetical protein